MSNYYQNNEKILQKKKDSEIYQSLYKEEKQNKRQYGCKQHKNLTDNEEQMLVENERPIITIKESPIITIINYFHLKNCFCFLGLGQLSGLDICFLWTMKKFVSIDYGEINEAV